jgi:hypothetical protein
MEEFEEYFSIDSVHKLLVYLCKHVVCSSTIADFRVCSIIRDLFDRLITDSRFDLCIRRVEARILRMFESQKRIQEWIDNHRDDYSLAYEVLDDYVKLLF